ncbi:tyrosine protein phosphatase [Evansella sp. LMS18]|uniref:tyrosine-protein phosphatase n=1 Tax=Evansella sp. LMS18 TaxID=2924033 RepID=UPI0020D0C3F2|nr:CpsB/CapC family capsule biosynthesis tyrosine phosphatase [Evansella sp. LMS18]UTR12133.1 tyrosine protein phosphatase [Evansella sp. LMS18]
MIDLHCHILPNLDDGSQSFEDTLLMAEKAVEEGITTIIATPHHNNGSYENEKQTIIQKTEKVNRFLNERNIDLKVFPGQEVRIYGEVIEDYKKGIIQTLADSKYIFIELPSGYVPRYTKDMIYKLQLEGLMPVIVHPERNQELIGKPEKLYEFVKNGTLTQLTAGSIAGKFGKKIKGFSEELIEANLAHFIASDAHNTTNRSFHMTAAYDYLQQEFGEDLVYFYKENAQLVLENKHVMLEQPMPVKRRKRIFGLF